MNKIIFIIFIFSLLLPTSVFSIDLNDNQFIFIGRAEKIPGKKSEYFLSVNNMDKKYRISLSKLKDSKKLSSILDAIEKTEYDARFTGTWAMVNNKKEIDPATLKIEMIKNAKDCPHKTFSRHNITGAFMGTECGDFCYTTIKDKNGRELTMYGNTEDIFGTKEGIKVSVNYEVAQAWLDTGDWGMCVIADFFVSGKKIK